MCCPFKNILWARLNRRKSVVSGQTRPGSEAEEAAGREGESSGGRAGGRGGATEQAARTAGGAEHRATLSQAAGGGFDSDPSHNTALDGREADSVAANPAGQLTKVMSIEYLILPFSSLCIL